MLTWSQRFHLRAWARSNMWLIPMGFVMLSIALSLVMPWLDRQITGESPFTYSASSAQATLSAIASGMLVFTGFVFSILTFAIQFSSSTFTPRLLRSVTMDTTPKVALGVFIATFIYALLLLAEVAPGDSEYVPQYSVLFAVVLVGICILLFLGLIVSVTGSIRSGRVVADVGRRGREVIDTAFPDPAQRPVRRAIDEYASKTPSQVVVNLGGGVLQAVDTGGIMAVAEAAEATVEMVPAVGDFVPTKATVFRVSGRLAAIDERRLLGSVAFGDERTYRQDPSYALRILVDVALKALSPAVNDPTTAVESLGWIGDLLLLLGSRQLPDGIHRNGDGEIRFVYRTPTWDEYLSLAFTEIRACGAKSPQVVATMRRTLDELCDVLPPWRQAGVAEQSRLLEEAVVGRSAR